VIAGIEPGLLRHWRIDRTTADLSREIGCSPLAGAILQMRGVPIEEDPRDLFHPDLDVLMERVNLGPGVEAAKEVFDRMKAGTRLVVYGDYDVDGVSATTLAARLFSFRDVDVHYFIPHRHQEGYGLHERIVRKIADWGCDVLVAVDCGTSSENALAAARDLGMEAVVFDHHLPREKRQAETGAVMVNPQFAGNPEAKALCGTAVLWAWAWKSKAFERNWLLENLGLVALATVADCVPLGPLNRALVREGLQKIREGKEPGLEALSNQLGLDLGALDCESLAMKVIPCLNAPGRLDTADLAVKVLSGESPLEKAVGDLVVLNRKRQGLTARIMEEARPLFEGKAGLVAEHHDWPVGVLSGVASRICSEMGCPVVLAAPVNAGLVRGTLRVPKGADAVSVLERLAPSLKEWGGHRQAAGFSVARQDWPSVRDSLEILLAGLRTCDSDCLDVLDLHPEDLSLEALEEIDRLGPFGFGNPGPLFYVQRGAENRIVSHGKDGLHARIEFSKASIVAFRSPELLKDAGSVEGWVYRARKGFWRGRARVDLFLEKPVVRRDKG